MHKKQTSYTAMLVLFLIIIIDDMGMGIIFPILSPLVMEPNSGLLAANASIHTRDFAYSALMSIFSLGLLFGAPILGDLSDVWGRKKSLVITLLLTAFSFGICALGVIYKSYSLLLIGRLLDGFSAGAASIAQAAIADMSTKENKAKNMSFITLAMCIGFVIGPLVGGYFSDNPIFGLGYSSSFWIAAVLPVLNMFALWWLFKETFQPEKKREIDWQRGLRIFVEAFKDERIRKLSLVFFMYEMFWAIYFQHVSLYLVQTYHYSASKIGYYMAYLGVLFAIALSIVIRIFLRYFKEAKIVKINLATTLVGVIPLLLFPSELMQWIVVIPIAFGFGIAYAALMTLFSNSVDEEHQGWVMGITWAIVAVTWFIGALLAGWTSTISGNLPFIVATAFIGVAFVLAVRWLSDD